MTTAAAALLLWLWSLSRPLAPAGRRGFALLAAAALAQVGLGIATLLLVVPVWLGALPPGGRACC